MAPMKPLVLFSGVLLLSTIVDGEILAEDSRSNRYPACDQHCRYGEDNNRDVSTCCKGFLGSSSFGVCGNDRTAACASRAPAHVEDRSGQCAELKREIAHLNGRYRNICNYNYYSGSAI